MVRRVAMSVRGAFGRRMGPSRELGRECGSDVLAGMEKVEVMGELYPELGADELEYADPDSHSLTPLLPTEVTDPAAQD